jgi:hypothetical protein
MRVLLSSPTGLRTVIAGFVQDVYTNEETQSCYE